MHLPLHASRGAPQAAFRCTAARRCSHAHPAKARIEPLLTWVRTSWEPIRCRAGERDGRRGAETTWGGQGGNTCTTWGELRFDQLGSDVRLSSLLQHARRKPCAHDGRRQGRLRNEHNVRARSTSLSSQHGVCVQIDRLCALAACCVVGCSVADCTRRCQPRNNSHDQHGHYISLGIERLAALPPAPSHDRRRPPQ